RSSPSTPAAPATDAGISRPPGSRPTILVQEVRAMISITSKSRYAVVAMAELAGAGDDPVPISQVAERRNMPVQFLEQLFSTLRRSGLLISQRGAKGSYAHTRPAARDT